MRSGVEAFFTPFLQLSLAARTPMDTINGSILYNMSMVHIVNSQRKPDDWILASTM